MGGAGAGKQGGTAEGTAGSLTSDGWSAVPSKQDKASERAERDKVRSAVRESMPPDQLEAEVTERLAFLGPTPAYQAASGGRGGGYHQGGRGGGYTAPVKSKYWQKPTDGLRADDWLRALPVLASKETTPLAKLVAMLSEAGAAGMELSQIARNLGTETQRVDLLKLKGYLACFPSRIVVASKTKPPFTPEGVAKRVDQVWLISDGN